MSRAADDPRRARSARLFWLFGWYLRWYFHRHFDAVRLDRAGRPDPAPGRPLIVYTNHPGWWDAAFYMLAAVLLFPRRAGYGPMDDVALGRYGMFRRLGVFGIETSGARGAARFLRTALDVLADPSAMLWVTAEGGFTDARRRPVRLRPGIAHLARRLPDAVLLPAAIEYCFWNESRPEALIRFGAPVSLPAGAPLAAWQAALEAGLEHAMDGLSASAMTRDPARFETLLRGRAGVGGIYDVLRRASATLAGRRFDPRHEPRTDEMEQP